jgi:uncharacterized coiled-coil protein SlyX
MSEDLKTRIDSLEKLVQKQAKQLEAHDQLLAKHASLIERQAKMLAETGQQLVSLQVGDVKKRMSELDATPNVDMDDYIKNEDIIQLVGELQGQLDLLEERNIARVLNYNNDTIVPLTNKNGEFPVNLNFPGKLEDFVNINDEDLAKLGLFYELIMSNDQVNDLNDFINSENSDVDVKQLLVSQSGLDKASRPDLLTKEQSDDLFDELARFLGLKARRNENEK